MSRKNALFRYFSYTFRNRIPLCFGRGLLDRFFLPFWSRLTPTRKPHLYETPSHGHASLPHGFNHQLSPSTLLTITTAWTRRVVFYAAERKGHLVFLAPMLSTSLRFSVPVCSTRVKSCVSAALAGDSKILLARRAESTSLSPVSREYSAQTP